MRELERPHEDLHHLIHEIIDHMSAGRRDLAEAAYARVEPLSGRIIALIEAIENKAMA
jgi:hypothetical protein